jgi:hypothetical protein
MGRLEKRPTGEAQMLEELERPTHRLAGEAVGASLNDAEHSAPKKGLVRARVACTSSRCS